VVDEKWHHAEHDDEKHQKIEKEQEMKAGR
jgi:hypothetical protein